MAETDFNMTIQLIKGEILATTKTHMVNLRQLFDVGNSYRREIGQSGLRMESWLAMDSTAEFIEKVTKDIGRDAKVTSRGKNGKTMVHLLVAIDAAMYLSSDLKLEVLRLFVEKRILDLRDDSADKYIDLNAMVAIHAEEVFGKPSHQGHYIQLANTIKKKCDVEDWSTSGAETLRERSRIEEALSTMLKAGVVRDWEHLKELAEKV